MGARKKDDKKSRNFSHKVPVFSHKSTRFGKHVKAHPPRQKWERFCSENLGNGDPYSYTCHNKCPDKVDDKNAYGRILKYDFPSYPVECNKSEKDDAHSEKEAKSRLEELSKLFPKFRTQLYSDSNTLLSSFDIRNVKRDPQNQNAIISKSNFCPLSKTAFQATDSVCENTKKDDESSDESESQSSESSGSMWGDRSESDDSEAEFNANIDPSTGLPRPRLYCPNKSWKKDIGRKGKKKDSL